MTNTWTIGRIEAFVRGLPRRLPRGSDDASVAARARIETELAGLNAHMLGRELDPRVPVDLDAMVDQVADRMARYTSADWSRNATLTAAESACDAMAEALRSAPVVDDEDDD